MKTDLKRFRVFDIEEQKLIGKFDTIEECVNCLSENWKNFKLNPYQDFFIDDIKDDIEVNWIDLMQAWDEGERPADLQMF